MTRPTTRSFIRLGTATAALALAAALVIPPAADAQRRGGFDRAERGGDHHRMHRGHGGRDGGLPLGRAARYLDLTDSQKEQAKALGEAFRQTTQPLREEIHANHHELKALLDGDGADPSQVGELVLDTDAARDQIAIQREALVEDFKDILDPEQLERFEAWQERWQERRDARQERRADRFGGDD